MTLDRKEYYRQYYLKNKPTPEMRAFIREADREKRKIANSKRRRKLKPEWTQEGKTKRQIYNHYYYLRHKP